MLNTALTGLKTLFNFAYLFISSMSTSAKAKTIIPKVTKALAWKYFTDNNNGTTVTCTLCKPKDVRVKVFEITNPKYYNLRYPKSHLRIQENCTIILQAIGGSTKGVRVHLSLHHKGEWKEIEEKERERKGENENEKVPNKGERIQPTIKASFEQMSKCALACDRNK